MCHTAISEAHGRSRYAVAIAFVLMTGFAGWNVPAYDLRASYVAGRLVANGQKTHIYDQIDHDSAHEDGSAWAKAALDGGIQDRVVTPYVQAPLWASLVSPLAQRLRFIDFKRVFLILTGAATVGLVFSATRQWTRALASPFSQAAVLAALFLTTPFFIGVELGQTNMLFLYIVTQAIIAEQRDRSFLAGLLLAFGSYTQITPMWIALTWLARGNWRAASSFAVSSLLLLLTTLIVGGRQNLSLYIRILKKTGQSVLLSYNNDSFSSVLMQNRLDQQTAFHFQPVPAPGWLLYADIIIIATSAVAIGLYERKQRSRQTGSIFTLVAATIFAPLAWNHYFVVLVLPVILFVDDARRHGKVRWMLLAGVVLVLNIPPLSYFAGTSLWIISLRSQFWAAMLCLLALPLLPNAEAPRAVSATPR
jgi:hypothetical protein